MSIPTPPQVQPVTTKLIDVYHGDGEITWSKVLNAGVGGGIVKCSEGLTVPDSQFAKNYGDMGTVGATRGAYHFLHPNQSGSAQAHFAYSQIVAAGGYKSTDLPVSCDIEKNYGASRSQVVACVHEFMTTIEQLTGKKGMVYTMPGFAVDFLDASLGDHPLWIAHLTNASHPTVPAGWKDWDIWQYAFGEIGNHPVDGCPGSVDCSRFRGSHADLVKHFGLA